MVQQTDNYGRPVETGTTIRNDNSGMGVILGVLLVLAIAVGAYYFFNNRDNAMNNAPATASTMAPASDATAVAPSAGSTSTTDTTTTTTTNPSAPAQ